jgi:hypothetical protein
MDASEELDRESESSEAFPHYAEATGEPRPSALRIALECVLSARRARFQVLFALPK